MILFQFLNKVFRSYSSKTNKSICKSSGSTETRLMGKCLMGIILQNLFISNSLSDIIYLKRIDVLTEFFIPMMGNNQG